MKYIVKMTHFNSHLLIGEKGNLQGSKKDLKTSYISKKFNITWLCAFFRIGLIIILIFQGEQKSAS